MHSFDYVVCNSACQINYWPQAVQIRPASSLTRCCFFLPPEILQIYDSACNYKPYKIRLITKTITSKLVDISQSYKWKSKLW